MKTVYVCTYVEKTVCVDHYEDGCETIVDCVVSQAENIQTDSLAELLDKINQKWFLDKDNIFVPEPSEPLEWIGCNRMEDKDGCEPSEPLEWIGCNRMEDKDGCEPSKRDIEGWKVGKVTLYLADYSYRIAKRTIETIDVSELTNSGAALVG